MITSSKQMYGLIDVARRKWKDSVGNISPIRDSQSGELLCPLCHVERREEVLALMPDDKVWTCARQHSYQEDTFPE